MSKAALPPATLLVAKAFDRAVVVTLALWPWFILCVVAEVAVRQLPSGWSRLATSYGPGLVWVIAAFIGTLRLTRPDFKPTLGLLLRLAGVYAVYELALLLGLLALIIPAFIVGPRLWVAPAAVALEDVGVRDAIGYSWELTGRAFSQTFGLFMFIILIDVAVWVMGLVIFRTALLFRLLPWQHDILDLTTATIQSAVSLYISAGAVGSKLLWFPYLVAQPPRTQADGPPAARAAPVRVPKYDVRDEAPIETPRLWLEPIVPEHARSLCGPLQDPLLYRYYGQQPPESESALRRRFEQLATRRSPDGSQIWLNWAVRAKAGPYVGLVQATIEGDRALIGYDIFVPFWRNGYGKEACAAMMHAALRGLDVKSVSATVDVDNAASIALLESLGFSRIWTGPSDDMPGHADHRYEFALV